VSAEIGQETTEVTYVVLNMDSDHSETAVSDRLLTNPGVDAVVVDLETKGVTVHGRGLDFAALRASIESGGYRAA
jgi:copper chaperone CopZ